MQLARDDLRHSQDMPLWQLASDFRGFYNAVPTPLLQVGQLPPGIQHGRRKYAPTQDAVAETNWSLTG